MKGERQRARNYSTTNSSWPANHNHEMETRSTDLIEFIQFKASSIITAKSRGVSLGKESKVKKKSGRNGNV